MFSDILLGFSLGSAVTFLAGEVVMYVTSRKRRG